MKKTICLFLATMFLFSQVKWIDNINEAKKLSLQKNLAILAMVSSKTCPSCRYMKKQVFTNEKVYKFINKNFIALHLDLEYFRGNIPKSFRGRGLPRFYFSNHSLEVYFKSIGGVRYDSFLKVLQQAKNKFKGNK